MFSTIHAQVDFRRRSIRTVDGKCPQHTHALVYGFWSSKMKTSGVLLCQRCAILCHPYCLISEYNRSRSTIIEPIKLNRCIAQQCGTESVGGGLTIRSKCIFLCHLRYARTSRECGELTKPIRSPLHGNPGTCALRPWQPHGSKVLRCLPFRLRIIACLGEHTHSTQNLRTTTGGARRLRSNRRVQL